MILNSSLSDSSRFEIGQKVITTLHRMWPSLSFSIHSSQGKSLETSDRQLTMILRISIFPKTRNECKCADAVICRGRANKTKP